MKIHLIKKRLFRGTKTLCNENASHWSLRKSVKTDLTDDAGRCTCNGCLIEHEKEHLSEALV